MKTLFGIILFAGLIACQPATYSDKQDQRLSSGESSKFSQLRDSIDNDQNTQQVSRFQKKVRLVDVETGELLDQYLESPTDENWAELEVRLEEVVDAVLTLVEELEKECSCEGNKPEDDADEDEEDDKDCDDDEHDDKDDDEDVEDGDDEDEDDDDDKNENDDDDLEDEENA